MFSNWNNDFKVLKNMNSILFKTFSILLVFILLTSFYPFRPGEYGLNKVVIDAGHGGKDPGAIGVDKMQEKDVVLNIALIVGAKIKAKYPNVKVEYTRDTDVFIGLNERAEKAQKMNADLFISIHADAAGSEQAHGTETFALGLHKSAANLETAKRENNSILMEDNYEVKYEGFDPGSDESYIILGLIQQASLSQSLSMAKKVQDQFTSIGRRNRGVKQAGFLVLVKTTMPSVLIETGFITNTKEGRFLSKLENRETISTCIFNAFGEYKSEIDEISKPPSMADKSKSKEAVDSGVRFRVQVASSPKQLKMDPEKFKGYIDIREIKVNDVYKYTIGNESNLEDAVTLQSALREKRYKDAFLIGIYQGKKISISEANSIIAKSKN